MHLLMDLVVLFKLLDIFNLYRSKSDKRERLEHLDLNMK